AKIRSLEAPLRNFNLDRILSCREYSSFAWLLAVPNRNLGLGMTSNQVERGLQIRLGHVDFSSGIVCSGNAQHENERSGMEVAKCTHRAFVMAGHENLAANFGAHARSAGMHHRREDLGILQDGSKARPGDVIIPNYDRRLPTVSDFRVTNNKQKMFTD